MKRNPNWTRDELILALDLYFRVDPARAPDTDPAIVALSKLLNELPIHQNRGGNTSFRNPNGVYMKLCNFLRLDPDYEGVGLRAGSRLDEVVWDEFATNREALAKTAAAIRHNYKAVAEAGVGQEQESDGDVFREGEILTRLHKMRERNGTIVRKKKQEVLKATGALACEVCDFDFAQVYGELGQGFVECHHVVPVASLRYERVVRLEELAIVCANCHRIIHRTQPVMEIHALRAYIESRG